MELTPEQIGTLEDFCWEHDCELRKNYSGRGMYGSECIGFVHDSSEFALGVKLAKWLKDDPELLEVFEDGGWMDSMGMSNIIYFRGVTAPEKMEA